MTCLTVIGGENIWKERAIASGFCETADGSVPKSKVNSFLRDFVFLNLCANSMYCGGPKMLLTDQHLLRTNLFFVTETSELRLAGLHLVLLAILCHAQISSCAISKLKTGLQPLQPIVISSVPSILRSAGTRPLL